MYLIWQRHLFSRSIPFVNRRFIYKKLNKTPVGSTFTIIYRLPEIFYCSLVNKGKKYSIASAGLLLPVSYLSFFCGLCDKDVPFITTTFGIATCSAFFIAGHFVNRLIGFVYVSKDRSEVKISYVDFWGDRKDEIYPIEDIQQIEPTSETLNYYLHDIFPAQVHVSNKRKPFKIHLKYGHIIHGRLFNKVFNTFFNEEPVQPK